jgi:hypothetical protein
VVRQEKSRPSDLCSRCHLWIRLKSTFEQQKGHDLPTRHFEPYALFLRPFFLRRGNLGFDDKLLRNAMLPIPHHLQ